MVKLELTAVLYSNKNYDLSYRLHKVCLSLCMNLINCISFMDLAIKTMQIKPQIVLCDMTTVDLSSTNIRQLLESEQIKERKIVFVGEDKHFKMLSNLNLSQIEFIKINDITNYLENSTELLKLKANEICKDDEQNSVLCSTISQILFTLGFSPKHTGFLYIRDVIKNIIKNDGVVSSLLTYQFPLIAVKFKTTTCNIERNIRNAISCAYNNFKNENWNKIFDNQFMLEQTKRPTNREFICMLVDKINTEAESNKLKYKFA